MAVETKKKKHGIWGIFLALMLVLTGYSSQTDLSQTPLTQNETAQTETAVTTDATEDDKVVSVDSYGIETGQTAEAGSDTESRKPVVTENPDEKQQDTELPADSSLQVHYIDVGQGDATLITCAGESMLIDAGNNNKGTLVQSYLMSQGVQSLDYVIGTHPDADHIGGLDVIITKFDCGTVFLTDDTKDTATYRDVISAMQYKGYNKTLPVAGDTYQLGGAEFTFVGPVTSNDDSNNNSIALLLKHGSKTFYFEGDAEEEEETSILNTGVTLSADVYKVGHHGSKTSTTDAMLAAVAPAYAVISVGAGNSYGHPNAETLNKLRAAGVSVFRTDEQGSIIAQSDGTTINWNCSPSESWQAGEPTGSSDSAGGAAASDRSDSVTGNAAAGAVAAGAAGAAVSGDTSQAQEAVETPQEQTVSGGDIMVHITATGGKYHSAGCQYLKKSDIEVTLQDAKARGLAPCSRCNPPQ